MRNTRSLFEITDDLLALNDLLDELGGDVTDEQVESALDSFFAEIESDLHGKLDGYAYLIAEHNADAEALRAEAKRLEERARARESAADRLKSRLKLFFERTGRAKEQTRRFTFSVRKNGGRLPLNMAPDVDPNALDPRFRLVKISVNAETVYAALKAGESLPFAQLGEQGSHVRIQ